MRDIKATDRLLEINDLKVSFPGKRGTVDAVKGATLRIQRGEVMGIVGESGSGKSTIAYAVMQLLKAPGVITGGEILYEGKDLTRMSQRDMEFIRGREIGMIFQDPMQCLDPVYTVGAQLIETINAHRNIPHNEAVQESIDMLSAVGIHNAEQMMKRYRHELSGGMQQRIMIAMALLCSPKLLIADEATTALDVTIQEQIIQLLKNIKNSTGMAIMLITHNFGLVSEICDRVSVMYGGHIVEEGAVDSVFYNASHPYTRGLIAAIPKVDLESTEPLMPIPGSPINPMDPPKGCIFHTRCTQCTERCRTEMPPVTEVEEGHTVRCWLRQEGEKHEQ